MTSLTSPYASRLSFESVSDPALRGAFETIRAALVSAPNQAEAENAALALSKAVGHTVKAVRA